MAVFCLSRTSYWRNILVCEIASIPCIVVTLLRILLLTHIKYQRGITHGIISFTTED